MKRRLLPYLACPSCAAELRLDEHRVDGDEVMEGLFHCSACSATYPVRGGIPRFADDVGGIERETAGAFGYEWNRYAELAPRYRKQFLDWIRPVGPGFFRDRVVLEGGCGKGRHTALAAEFGARDVVALDLGDAVEAAFRNTRHLPNAHIVQADLNRPPVKPGAVDYAFSVGVLHHTPEPERGFRALASRVRPGGVVSVWVYGREGNGWIVHLVTPIREKVTARLPHAVLDALSGAFTVPLWLATKLVYGPARRRGSAHRLPYGEYLSYIAPFPFHEQRSIVFDHLATPIAFYLRREEVAGWFERLGLEKIRIAHHNGNSWRGFGRVPAAAGER